MIANVLRFLNIRRRNVVHEIQRDTIDRLNRQIISARLRADKAEGELANIKAKRSRAVAAGNRTRKLKRLAAEAQG